LLNLTLGLIILGFRGSMVFCIEKSCPFLATLLSLELGVAIHMAWFEGELFVLPWVHGELMLYHVYCIFWFSIAFSSYSSKSLCFTCYTSLYLLNYAYHCARMSSNEM
jgi:hypothetical protein